MPDSAGALRIAMLGTRGFPGCQGGVERHVEAISTRLVAMGCRVTVYTRPAYIDAQLTEHAGVGLCSVRCARSTRFEAITHSVAAMLHACRHRRTFDLLHVHAIGPSLVVPLGRMVGLPVVMTHHGPDYDRAKWGRMAKAFLHLGERTGIRFASRVIAVSPTIQRDLSGRLGCAAEYIPNGVELEDAEPLSERLTSSGIAAGRYILGVGRLVPEKGFHDLLDAFDAIPEPWQLVIAGGADHESGYSRELQARAAATPRVLLTGAIPHAEVSQLFANAALFVLPSYHEGLPVVLLEAMGLGAPVLASSISANRDAGGADLPVFAPGDVKALREGILHMLQQPPSDDQRQAMRARVRAEFNWDRVARMTCDVYHGIVGHA